MATPVLGAALGSVVAGGASTQNISGLAISGSNLCILVGVRLETNARSVTSLNWDDGAGGSAQAFTQWGATVQIEASNHEMNLWYLVNPNTANSRIIVTINANDVIQLGGVYYTGVDQTTPLSTASTAVDTATPGSQSDTSDKSSSIHVGFVGSANAGLSITTGTSRQQFSTQPTHLIDEGATGTKSGASDTFDFTWSGGGSAGWITAFLRPAVADAGAVGGMLPLMGVG